MAIVNHITAGLMPGTLSWLQNPQAQASAHYLITKTGQIYQLVKDEDTAWHAGIVNKPDWPLYDNSNPNYYTLGIEHEALPGQELTEPQYQASLWLHGQLAAKYGIPIDKDHIIGHCRIDSVNRKNDPGSGFPWERLFNDLSVQQTHPVIIKVNNQFVHGVIIDNVSYAPVRALVESLGGTVEWNNTLRAVLIPPVFIQVPAASSAGVNIAAGSIVFTGRMINERVYAPVRQLAEALGHRVDWDAENRMVIIE